MLQKFFNIIEKSFVLVRRNIKLILSIAALDVFFIYLYSFISSYFKENIFSSIAKVTPDLVQKAKSGISLINYFWQSNVRSEIIINGLLLIISVYLLYALFQGTTWALAHKITGKKVGFGKYLTYFAKVNTLWLVLFLTFLLVDLYLTIDAKLSGRTGLQTSIIPAYANIAFFFAILYFALNSYVTPSLKKSFLVGWKRKQELIPRFLFILVIYLVIDFIINNLWKLNQTFALVIGFILVFLALAWMRIFIILSLETN